MLFMISAACNISLGKWRKSRCTARQVYRIRETLWEVESPWWEMESCAEKTKTTSVIYNPHSFMCLPALSFLHRTRIFSPNAIIPSDIHTKSISETKRQGENTAFGEDAKKWKSVKSKLLISRFVSFAIYIYLKYPLSHMISTVQCASTITKKC